MTFIFNRSAGVGVDSWEEFKSHYLMGTMEGGAVDKALSGEGFWVWGYQLLFLERLLKKGGILTLRVVL